MVDASPTPRQRRSRRRHDADHIGERCTMCGRRVVVDADGRCALGHQVLPPVPGPVVPRSDGDGAVVATFVEDGHATAAPTERAAPPDPVALADTGQTAEAVSMVFDDPPPPLPSQGPEGDDLPGPSPLPRRGRAAVGVTDLTPRAPSALDLPDSDWVTPAVTDASTPIDEHVDDDLEVEPPRGLLQMIAGGVFVAMLLAVAWYLATSL